MMRYLTTSPQNFLLEKILKYCLTFCEVFGTLKKIKLLYKIRIVSVSERILIN